MAPVSPLVLRLGYHDSCGDHSVRVEIDTDPSGESPTIDIWYDQDIGDQEFWWTGEKPSAADLTTLLDSADVPSGTQRVDALDMILGRVREVLKEHSMIDDDEDISSDPRNPVSGFETASCEEKTDVVAEEGVEYFDKDEYITNLFLRAMRDRSAMVKSPFFRHVFRRRSCVFKKRSSAKKMKRKKVC